MPCSTSTTWPERGRWRQRGGGVLPHLLLASMGPHLLQPARCVVLPCAPCCAWGWGEGQCLPSPCSAPQHQLRCLGPLPQHAPSLPTHSGATLHLLKRNPGQGYCFGKEGSGDHSLPGSPPGHTRQWWEGCTPVGPLGEGDLTSTCRGPSTRTPDLATAPDPACISSSSRASETALLDIFKTPGTSVDPGCVASQFCDLQRG